MIKFLITLAAEIISRLFTKLLEKNRDEELGELKENNKTKDATIKNAQKSNSTNNRLRTNSVLANKMRKKLNDRD